jgi:hypothetical protein
MSRVEPEAPEMKAPLPQDGIIRHHGDEAGHVRSVTAYGEEATCVDAARDEGEELAEAGIVHGSAFRMGEAAKGMGKAV